MATGRDSFSGWIGPPTAARTALPRALPCYRYLSKQTTVSCKRNHSLFKVFSGVSAKGTRSRKSASVSFNVLNWAVINLGDNNLIFFLHCRRSHFSLVGITFMVWSSPPTSLKCGLKTRLSHLNSSKIQQTITQMGQWLPLKGVCWGGSQGTKWG